MSVLWAFRKLTLETSADMLHLLICGHRCVSVVGIHVMLKVCGRRPWAILFKASFVGCGTESERARGSLRVTQGHTVPSALEAVSGGGLGA